MRVDTQPLIERDVHQLGGASPVGYFARLEAGALGNEPVGARLGGLQLLHGEGSVRRFSRAIRFVYVLLLTTVVYSSGPVTRWMQKRPSLALGEEAQVVPQAGGLDQHLGAALLQEVWSPVTSTYFTIP